MGKFIETQPTKTESRIRDKLRRAIVEILRRLKQLSNISQQKHKSRNLG